MSGRNLESYLDDAEGFAALSEEEQARLMTGATLEGDTAATPKGDGAEISDTPGAESEATTEDQPAVEPVVLAKDGQHTIPFAELEAAREKVRQIEQELNALKASKEDRQSSDADPAADATESLADRLEALDRQEEEIERAFENGEIDHREMRKHLKVLSDERMDLKLSDVQAKLAEKQNADLLAQRQRQEQELILADANKRAAALVEQYPFLDPQGPATNRKAIDLVVLQRDKFVAEGMSFADAIEKAVGEIAPLFEQATTTKQPPSADMEKKAAAAISKAQAKTPISLSQVPAGAMAHHDEGEAIRSMDMNRLSRTMEGKTPAEIMRLMSRVL